MGGAGVSPLRQCDRNRAKKSKIRGASMAVGARDEGRGRRRIGKENEVEETRVGRGRKERSAVRVEMENLPTELFLARILRPAVCQNEEGNIISLPSGSFSSSSRSAAAPPFRLSPPLFASAVACSSRPIVPFLVNREFEL